MTVSNQRIFGDADRRIWIPRRKSWTSAKPSWGANDNDRTRFCLGKEKPTLEKTWNFPKKKTPTSIYILIYKNIYFQVYVHLKKIGIRFTFQMKTKRWLSDRSTLMVLPSALLWSQGRSTWPQDSSGTTISLYDIWCAKVNGHDICMCDRCILYLYDLYHISLYI